MVSICRRELNDLLEVMWYLNDSDSSSSDEEDMDLLVIQAIAFPPKSQQQTRICLDSISDLDCEQLFR